MSELYKANPSVFIEPGCITPDWEELDSLIGNIFVRLVTDVDAFHAYVTRLAQDGNKFLDVSEDKVMPDKVWAILHEYGPHATTAIAVTDVVLVMRNPAALAALSRSVRENTSIFWELYFNDPRAPFVENDRDDIAATCIYMLSQTLPR
jgi:hypothetical protein